MFNVEFYNTPDGDIMIKEHEKPIRMFSEQDRDLISKFITIINDRYPEAFKKLSEIYTKSSRNKNAYEFRIVRRFIKCNFGEYDQIHYDIDQNGNFLFEEVKCPLRGECPYEGCICKPVLNTVLSEREMEVLRLIAHGKQAQEIADELFISVSTVNRHRENIKAKIKANSVSQLTAYFYKNNLE